MFEVELLDNQLDNLHFPTNEGFESTIFLTDSYNYTKIFREYISLETLVKKERILIALHFSRLYDHSDEILPEVYRLIHKKDGTFMGYSMVSLSGQSINEFCEELTVPAKLTIFQKVQEVMKIIHEQDFCLTDFNPGNILVTKDLKVRFVDIDSFCLPNDLAKNYFFNYRYVCPYCKTVDKKFNIYSFYALLLDTLFKMNKTDNKKKEILQRIMQEKNLPQNIKDKLIYFVKIHNKKQVAELEYLF